MKPADVCIAVLVAVIWGLAFVASRIALNEFSPELMTTLRFSIAALPCLFVARPKVSWGASFWRKPLPSPTVFPSAFPA
jgi:O-acetylserine/cysteine efflux transporter